MCISFEASVIAFIIGEYSGYKLYQKSDTKAVGIFIMWYSIIQILEAGIYKLDTKYHNSITKLMIINLSLQGLVFMFYQQKHPLKQYFLIVSILLATYGVYVTFTTEKTATISEACNCLKWNFAKDTNTYLFYMYGLIFMYSILSNTKVNRKLFYITFSLYVIIYSQLTQLTQLNKPSIWCISSAVSAPLMLL